MKIQVEVSIYPLKTDDLGKTISIFVNELQKKGLTVIPGDMSSQVAGEAEEVFSALGRAFNTAACESEAVMIVKASNACPTGTD